MHLTKNSCQKIAALIFLTATLASIYVMKTLNFTDLLALTGSLFTGIITAGLWLEVSYRYLLEEATEPLDNLIEKL